MEQKYKTKDLHEATALVTCGSKLVGVERVESIVWFVFDNKEECLKLADSFYFGGLVGSLKLFSENLKTLKGKVFSGGVYA